MPNLARSKPDRVPQGAKRLTVMTEVCHLLLQRCGTPSQLKFIEIYRQGVFTVFDLDASYAGRLNQLMQTYADLPMDLADASRLVA